ncbi:chitobiase/beta-hexosaminidase C-terminal domain-containing protein [Tissierella carlieri]|uniref:chitobiase/beta-hexosaminidase C-terminal domain-containing protein n=1 Tax=Tissierella carlieri TaxID=689904 RepID=UPI001C11D157|nr:chitobiase/beta-hexosaminidase C-terminal domain-containing protein [Tissierella carlieri]MBU5313145.1 chitobiase/beta-hexosaminidase C-terminal domain-containing protein [Tissierella carlieri]
MRRRFISFVLAIIVLIPLVPMPVFSNGLVKEIDVFMNNFRVQVEGKNFSHKEVFLYEGDIFVPMKDFGKALGLGVNFNSNKRALTLNSNNKLRFNDNSKYPIAYQRGYEIEVKERLMDNINQEIRDFLRDTKSKSSSKDIDLKTIRAGFSGIEITLDGKKIFLDGEPLLYNDDVYLPLTSLSPYLYITPKLNNNVIDIDCNGVLKDKPKDTIYPSYYSIDELVKFREDLNNRYARELEELNKKKKIIMDVKIPYEEVKSLSDMERYLNRHLSKINNLNVDINLRSGTGHWYYVDIDFSTRDNSKWRNLSRRDVEAYIWDIYVAISSLYDEEARIQGNIKRYVSFDTKMKNIVFSFIDSGLDMKSKVDPVFIEELLNKALGKYGGEYFDYTARISGYDLELVITPSHSDYMERWSPSRKLDLLERVNREIRRYYPGLKVNGKVVYRDLEPISFTIDDNKVRSTTLMASTAEYLNNRYGIFYVNGFRVPVKYSLHQIDNDNFKLMVDMDLSLSDSRWDINSKDALADLMQEVMKLVIDMWDANVFVQVFDKSQHLVYEYIVSQDTVQMVMANPSGGEVVEGSTVTLNTSTSGAKIYYTLDGSMPTINSSLYTGPIVISSNTIIKAFAVRNGFKDSAISTFEYTIVADDNMATGLDSLRFDIGTLSPRFDRKEPNYTLTLPYGTSRVKVTPSASVGSITVNDSTVDSGDSVEFDAATSTIRIVHIESGKAKNRVYTINVKIEDKQNSNVKLESYSFDTFGYGVFSGQLSGNYSGHKVRLLSTTGKEYDNTVVESNGRFEIVEFPTGVRERLIGYKYEVRDINGNLVDFGPLNER